MANTTTWRKEITEEMEKHGDGWTSMEAWSASAGSLSAWADKEFDNSYGDTEGPPFTLWTNTRVYFPVAYDGREYCKSVSRHPDGHPTSHIGGRT